MKSLICFTLSAIMITSGCSLKETTTGDPLTRILVAQAGQNSILVVDMDTPPQLRSVDVPISPDVSDSVGPKIDIHPWGNIGYVTSGQKTYIMNLTSGAEIAAGTITGKGTISLFENGGYLIASPSHSSSEVSLYSTINPRLINTLSLVDRYVDGIATCDDNKTILLVTRAIQHSMSNPLRFYVTKLGIDSTGQLTNPGHELLVEDIDKVECASGSNAGVATTISDAKLISFTINQNSGLTRVETEDAVVNGPSGVGTYILHDIVFNPDSTELFVHISTGGLVNPRGWIEKFSFDPVNAVITPVMGWLADAPHSTIQTIADRLAMAPDGAVIYVTDRAESKIRVIKTSDGTQAEAITDQLITRPTNISVGRVTCYDPNNTGCD